MDINPINPSNPINQRSNWGQPAIPLIYVAGPFRGPTPLDVRRNVERARDLGLRVAQAGGYPMIPHTMASEFDKQLTDQFWLDGTLEMMRRCDGAVFTSNYDRSSGARTEFEHGTNWNMPMMIDQETDAPAIDRLRVFIAAIKRSMATGEPAKWTRG